MMEIEIYDSNDIQYRPPARGLKFSKIWQAGEDLTLGFVLDRSCASNWPDVGYGYRVELRNGLDGLWRGYVRGIEQGEEEIAITALGTWILLDDFPYIGGGSYPGTKGRLWSDNRYGKWKHITRDQLTNGREEKFEINLQNKIEIAPRKGENHSTTVWGGVFYRCLYDDIKRVTFTAAVYSFTGWDAKLEGYASDWTGASTIWQYSTDGVGAIDKTLTTEKAILALYIWQTSSGDYTGETGVTRLKVTGMEVFGTDDIVPTVTDVAGDIVDQLQSGTDIESDKNLIETISLTLEPLYYEEDEACLDALEDAASFGDANNEQLAWGVESGGARIFVKAPDRESVRYVVPPEHCPRLSAKGDTTRDYYSAATGKYVDAEGETQYTEKYYAHVTATGITATTTSTGDDLASEVFGVQRETVVPFGRLTSTLAINFIKQFVIEHGHPQVASSVEVIGQVQDLHAGGAWIEPYECAVGYLVQTPHFRAVEAEGASGVDLREWDTTFLLIGLQWDEDRGVARLIPEGAQDDLKAMMEFTRRFRDMEKEQKREKRRERLGM